jgi:hypothetical protein
MTTMAPCDGLDFEARANRIAQYLKTKPETTPRPGFCVLCGRKLPVALRAVKCVRPRSEDLPAGEFLCRENAEDTPEVRARIDAFKREHPADKWGTHDGWLFASVTACGSLDENVWTRACQIEAQRKAEARRLAATEDAVENLRTKRAIAALSRQ